MGVRPFARPVEYSFPGVPGTLGESTASKLCSWSTWFSLTYFRAQVTAKALPTLEEDNRLVPILNNLSQGFVAGVSSEWVAPLSEGSGDEIRADMVDEIAQKHYPLCMWNMHRNLKKDHHLKHFERLTYGLFLKVRVVQSFTTGHC